MNFLLLSIQPPVGDWRSWLLRLVRIGALHAGPRIKDWQKNSYPPYADDPLTSIPGMAQWENLQTTKLPILIGTERSISRWRILVVYLAGAGIVLSGFPDTDTFCIDIEQILSGTEDIHQCFLSSFNCSF